MPTSEPRAPTAAPPRETVALGLRCDGTCVFCAQAGLPPHERTEAEVALALDAARARGDAVTFVGGEPLLAAGLAGQVRRARALGFTRVGVQTNGVLLAAPGAVDALADAGLTDVHFSLHGARPEVHDFHAGRAGALAHALSALRAARARGLSVSVTSVLTRSAFRVVSELPRLLAQSDVGAWCIALPVARGRAADAFDRVMPRLALALPFALHALDAAATLRLPAFLEGAPLCLVGPFAGRVLRREERAYGAACEDCAARAACPGVDAAYLERWGGDELSAARAPSSVAPLDAREAALAATFVGIGEAASAPAASARARVALPLLGKVRPGRQEVSRGATRKTGDALRDLFPALFAAQPRPEHEWPVETVLVGSGRRARVLAKAARGAAGLVFIAVASPHAPEHAPLDAEGARVVRSLAEALDARLPAAVVVASSTAAHADAVRLALSRGLPVLVEKPVGTTPDETASLADDARARGLCAMPAWQLALLPGLEALRTADARDVSVTLAFPAGSPDAPRSRAEAREPLYHALTVLHALLGGALPEPSAATLEGDPPRRVHVAFSGAAELVLDFDAEAQQVVVRAGDLVLERSPSGLVLGRGDDRQALPGRGGDAERVLAHFRDVVRGDATPRFTLDDAARLEAVLDRILALAG